MTTRDEIRDLMRRYPSSPDRTRAALDAALAEPTPALVAASILGDYGFTAGDIRAGLAEGGSIDVLAFTDDEDGDQR
jgi:hypothetical protein